MLAGIAIAVLVLLLLVPPVLLRSAPNAEEAAVSAIAGSGFGADDLRLALRLAPPQPWILLPPVEGDDSEPLPGDLVGSPEPEFQLDEAQPAGGDLALKQAWGVPRPAAPSLEQAAKLRAPLIAGWPGPLAVLPVPPGARSLPGFAIRPGGPAPVAATEILGNAERLLGIPYLWGGTTDAGLDCSAFLSRAWGVRRQTTDTLHTVAYPIAKDDLLPGDALNLTIREDPRGYGHVRLFDRWANAERTWVWVYEETPPRSVHHVIRYDPRYTPMRRINYLPGDDAGLPSLPATLVEAIRVAIGAGDLESVASAAPAVSTIGRPVADDGPAPVTVAAPLRPAPWPAAGGRPARGMPRPSNPPPAVATPPTPVASPAPSKPSIDRPNPGPTVVPPKAGSGEPADEPRKSRPPRPTPAPARPPVQPTPGPAPARPTPRPDQPTPRPTQPTPRPAQPSPTPAVPPAATPDTVAGRPDAQPSAKQSEKPADDGRGERSAETRRQRGSAVRPPAPSPTPPRPAPQPAPGKREARPTPAPLVTPRPDSTRPSDHRAAMKRDQEPPRGPAGDNRGAIR